MGVTVNANFLSVVHAGSTGISPSFPDVCKTPTPGGPVPIPYPNIAQSTDTDQGTDTVKCDQKKVMLKGSNLKTSTGDEAGSAQGVASNKIKGKAEFVNYSFDVKFDGKNVVRLLDPATTNAGSSPNTASPAIGQPPVAGMTKPSEECKKTKKKEDEQSKSSPSTNWGKCGIISIHRTKIAEAATQLNVILYFRATNEKCGPWIRTRHQPKPHSKVDAKTVSDANVAECQAWLDGKTGDRRHADWIEEHVDIAAPPLSTCLGIYSSNAKHFLGVVMEKLDGPTNGKPLSGFGMNFGGYQHYMSKWITADYDLMDVVCADGHCTRPHQEGTFFARTQMTINSLCKWDAIQHGPQAQFTPAPGEFGNFDVPKMLKRYLASKDTTPPRIQISKTRSLPMLDNNLTVVAPNGRVMTLESDEDVKNALLCAGCDNPKQMKK